MPEAAHLTHNVTHSLAIPGLIVGIVAGAAIAVAVVGTGGAVLVVAAAAASGASMGGSIGKLIGTHISGPDCGPIIVGSPNVFFEGLPAARVMDLIACNGGFSPFPHPGSLIAQGSGTVQINSLLAARLGDKATCGATINHGCSTIIIGGATVTKLPIDAEIPAWVDWGLTILGIAGGVGLLKAAGYSALGIGTRIGGGVAGGMGGSLAGGEVAEYLGFPEGSWQRDAIQFIGESAGGWIGFKGGEMAVPNKSVTSNGLTGGKTTDRGLGEDGYRSNTEHVKANSRSIDDVTINKEGIDTIHEHLSRPEFLENGEMAANNKIMIERAKAIERGELEPTKIDKDFFAHETREAELMRGGMSYDEAHAQACKEYGINGEMEKGGKAFYTEEAMNEYDKQVTKNYLGY